jgi:hypothetical protein
MGSAFAASFMCDTAADSSSTLSQLQQRNRATRLNSRTSQLQTEGHQRSTVSSDSSEIAWVVSCATTDTAGSVDVRAGMVIATMQSLFVLAQQSYALSATCSLQLKKSQCSSVASNKAVPEAYAPQRELCREAVIGHARPQQAAECLWTCH